MVSDERGHDGPPMLQAVGCRAAVHRPLCLEHLVDAAHGLGRERRPGDLGQLEGFPPEVGPAGGLGDRPGLAVGPVELAEPGIGVGLQDPGVGGQVASGVLGRAVAGEPEQRGRGCRSGKGPVVPHIGPEPGRDGLAAGE